jgi:high-affinity iron transporter
MIVRFIRGRLPVLMSLAIALVVALAPRAAAAEAGEPPELDARRMVHILGYVAADYGGAVEGGAITNKDEFDEQLLLLTDAAKIAERIQPAVPSAPAGGGEKLDLIAAVAKVRGLVEAKAPEGAVAEAAGEARSGLINAFRLAQAPSSAPSAERGKALYAEHCATCHGETGRADTPRAATFTPRPASFLDPNIGENMTPFRVASTVRFGVSGTAMIPFTFLPEAEQWDLAFFVTGLRHTAAPASEAPTYALGELAVRSDAEIRKDLAAAGIPEASHDAILADLRRRAPYDDRASSSPLTIARSKLHRAEILLARGERDAARSHIIDAYLEGIEPAEPAIRASDAALALTIEDCFRSLRARFEAGAPAAEVSSEIASVMREITRAEAALAPSRGGRSFASTAFASAGILLREGVEAALLIAALLGLAAQAGLGDRKRYVHLGWGVALGLGALTWLVSSKLIAISGARRELIEGVTALLAMGVLFYVSYSLLAKREVARWMKFLRERVSKRSAALSLFGVALLAAYREAFETVLFYQALLASNASVTAALAGALAGAVLLVLLVVAYTRAGRFAPPQVFFKISSYLLYGLAVIFAGQGVSALQLAGVLPLHPVPGPAVPALGIYPTLETLGAQLVLLGFAAFALFMSRSGSASSTPAAPQKNPAGETKTSGEGDLTAPSKGDNRAMADGRAA